MIMKAQKLYYWKPDRTYKYPQIILAPTKENGERLELFEGSDMGNLPAFQLTVPKNKNIPDFLNYIMRYLFVSERVITILEKFKVTSKQIYPFSIAYKGKAIDTYYWVNLIRDYDIIDREKSEFELSYGNNKIELFDRITKFVPDYSAVPEDDLFELSCNISAIKIFKEDLVKAILQNNLPGASFIPLEEYTKPF